LIAVRRRHFEELRPICPLCLSRTGRDVPLKLAFVEREADGHVLEGGIHCTNPACQCEYPILDGIPLLIPQIRGYIANSIGQLFARSDLSESMESMLGDGCGPGSAFDVTRFHLSSYAWDHYGEFDPRENKADLCPGSVVKVLAKGLELAGRLDAGPVLDAGCSVGRTTFELARGGELVLGIDLNYSMLRLAAGVLHHQKVRYPRRRVGLVYERREFPAPFAQCDNLDFWACDAAALPFSAGTFATAINLNVLDCMPSPLDLLRSLHSTLRPGGKLILTTPYDWTGAVTTPEAWIGGHSQRSPSAGMCEPVLRALLTPAGHPAAVAGLRLTGEIERLAWQVRSHDRSATTYAVHLVVAQKEVPGRS
jgi:SAM-dependent methyltransferase